jgi:hypothetical protein
MLRDLAYESPDLFMTLAPGVDNELRERSETPPIDPLDDVFGSAPSSPILRVEGSEDTEGGPQDQASTHLQHPSDIPRLRSIHVTNGYREGIAASKEQHLQIGFDEGYSLGAEIGLKAGWCMGVLDGLMNAVRSKHANENDEHGEYVSEGDMRSLVNEAKEDLKMENLCGRDYIGEDGIWLYPIPGLDDVTLGSGSDVAFDQVAAAHPIIAKWVAKVMGVSQKLNLDLV